MSDDLQASPIAKATLAAAAAGVATLWKRIEKRAPEVVRTQVNGALATFGELSEREGTVAERLALAKSLENLAAMLKGRPPWEPSFYRDGRLAVVRAQDPIKIRGAVDHRRIDEFWERYVVRAEKAFERLEYFFSKAGILRPEDKVEKKPWEQAYSAFDSYRELIWGKVSKAPPRVRRE